MRSLRLVLAIPCLMLALAACGDTVTTTEGASGSAGAAGTSGAAGNAGAAGTGTGGREPAVHRAMASECTAERPPGSIGAGPDEGACKMDSECMSGDNGRCVQDIGQPTECSYDECALDADCGGSSVCECRNPANHNANGCFHGNCVVDADCGPGGYCSPSAVTLSPFCTEGVPIGSVGYFCHTKEDECIDDADCGDQGAFACFFNVDKLHYACFELLCVN
jgi:hypothetical protein